MTGLGLRTSGRAPRDVLVHPKRVTRVPRRFDLHEPVVVLPRDGSDVLLALLFRQEVDMRVARREAVHLPPRRAGPVDLRMDSRRLRFRAKFTQVGKSAMPPRNDAAPRGR